MSIHFHPLRVKAIRKETQECVSVEFEVPEDLKNDFQFNQGQSLSMRTFINGEEIRRTYSLCSSPLDQQWKVAIKKVEGGLFSSFANEDLKVNDTIEVMEPVGKFYTPLDPSHKKNYLAFAAGSGITPVISIIRTTLRTEPESSFTLVFGNRSRSSIIFFEELEGLKNTFLDRFTLIHILSRERTETPLNTGRIDVSKLNELGRIVDYGSMDEIFLCGPEEMIFCVKDYLESKGVAKKNIHFELFTTPGSGTTSNLKTAGSEKTAITGGPKCRVTMQVDGRSFDFDLALGSDTTLLDAALEKGADLPYACKGGMCCTCKAKLLEGEVQMDVHWGLEDEEIAKGFILTCQSHPKTERVVIDFDIK
jgi:ring-1,2-phenylacetyl-CoA epoxidase subunit PaaE